MAVTVLLEVNTNPDQVEALRELFAKILPDTRAYDGCQGVNLFCNQDEGPNMVLIEKWETRQHYEKYLGCWFHRLSSLVQFVLCCSWPE